MKIVIFETDPREAPEFDTPHSAFNAREAMRRIVTTTVANSTAFLEARPTNVAGAR